jgi:ubiquinone/menaquinone biosynthesis C-methylase UbiE
MSAGDTTFAGSIPALYDRYLGPLIFAPYAEHVAGRFARMTSGRLLELAAGTGIVTEALVKHLAGGVEIVATDLNQAMLDHAATKPALARAKLRQADALALPFADGGFDAVVCQFGVMFYPDRVQGHREARRVLKPGGRYVFSLWDSLEHNPITRCVVDAAARHLPRNPPRFLARTPHGHYDRDKARNEVMQAGFSKVDIDIVTLPSRAPSHRDPAIGFCQGTPMRAEIEAEAPQGLQQATDAVAAALAHAFGEGPIEAPMQALVVTGQV